LVALLERLGPLPGRAVRALGELEPARVVTDRCHARREHIQVAVVELSFPPRSVSPMYAPATLRFAAGAGRSGSPPRRARSSGAETQPRATSAR
jgi:hypothetical protein